MNFENEWWYITRRERTPNEDEYSCDRCDGVHGKRTMCLIEFLERGGNIDDLPSEKIGKPA